VSRSLTELNAKATQGGQGKDRAKSKDDGRRAGMEQSREQRLRKEARNQTTLRAKTMEGGQRLD